jgi:hypothetical protein
MSTSNHRNLVLVANDKGGVGKSLLAALLTEQLAETEPWTLVEVEQRSDFTQRAYRHPANVRLVTTTLLLHNEGTNQTDLSLAPLDRLWDLLPAESDTASPSKILVDCGASTFQSLLLWGTARRGLKPFRNSGYRFIFVIPVQGADKGAADFYNSNTPSLKTLGDVVLVRNFRAGSDFSLLDPKITSTGAAMNLLFKGSPVTEELQDREQCLTFRQLSKLPSASRRARLDAEECDEHFTAQLLELRKALKF